MGHSEEANSGTEQLARSATRSLWAAAEREGLLAAMVDSSSDAIIGEDLNGIIQSWNEGAEQLFGYTADEALGQPITMLAVPDLPLETPGILARIRRGEKVPSVRSAATMVAM
jgi:PAS domain S-box-containing protein